MEIIRCDDSHERGWNTFVEQSPAASLYHRYEWRGVNAKCFGHRSTYLAAFDGGRVVGVFPFVQVKSALFGNIACSLPFVNYGGPCAAGPEIAEALVKAAVPIVEEWRADYLEIRTPTPVAGLPSAHHKVSLTVTLESDPDVLFKAFTSAHRQDIRSGYKKGLTARIGGAELLADFYAVLSESWRDLGTPIYSRRYLETVMRTFPQFARICVVYFGSEPAAASLDMLAGNTVEGLWLGSRAKFRKQYAGYVLYWELIKNACERGLSTFHLGRSTAQSGGEIFKKKWNARTDQLYWQYVLLRTAQIPSLNVGNPRYQLAIKAWQKLPVPVTQMIGPYIARSIP